MKKLIFILILVLMGCAGEDGEDLRGGWPAIVDATTDTPLTTVSNPSGVAFKGAFRKRTQVLIYPLGTDWTQLDGGPYRGETTSNDGSYQIRASVTGSHVRYLLGPGSSYNEADGVWSDGVELSLRTINNENPKNINVLTAVADTVAFERFIDPSHAAYEDSVLALRYGRNETIAFFGMTDQIGDTLLQDTALQGDTTADAACWAASLAVAIGKGDDGGLINDYIQEISNGVVSNDTTLKSEIASKISGMEWKKVSDLLKNIHTELDISATFPPFWNLPVVPEYYEIMQRTPVEQGSKNKAEISKAGLGISTYNEFQWPIRFDNPGEVEASKYIALNIDNGDLSIWTKGGLCNGYEIKGTKVADLTKLREVLLPDGYPANYLLGEGLASGVDYILIQEKATPSDQPSLITGEDVPFSQNSASDDGFETCLAANATKRFATSIKWILFD